MSQKNAHRLLEYLEKFTSTYKAYKNDTIERLELECLKIQYPYILNEILPQDQIAGRILHAPIGISPQHQSGFGYYRDQNELLKLAEHPNFSSSDQQRIYQLIEFWDKEHTSGKVRQAYPPDMAEALPSDNWTSEPGIGFPLYRMSGSHLDYQKLLTLGIPGLRKEITNRINNATEKSRYLYESMLEALDLLTNIALWYADQAVMMNKSDLARTLKNITTQKPETMLEAIQLTWLYALLSGSVNYGRIDVYLTPFYQKVIESDNLTETEALDLLKNWWTLMNERENGIWIFDSRVIIGGKGRPNEQWADRLALLCIQATRDTHNVIPQLTLRFYNDQNPELYEKALDCIATSNPYPMLYNDEVNIPSAMHAFDLPENEAIDCIPYGCGEYVIWHKSFGTPSGVINHLQALLVTLNKGIDPITGKKMGIASHEIGEFDSFDDLLSAYKKQVEYYVYQLGQQEYLEYQIAGQTAPFLFFSMLFDDCIERGKAIFDGGIRYLGGTLETYGNSNAADSLLAIKKLVFDEKRFTLDELREILKTNFNGFEKERNLMLNLPKYGNDENEADEMLVEIDEHVFQTVREQRHNTGLHSYLVVVINNSANTVMGRHTAASPDGRKAGTPMNNGNTPSSGMDKNGITAFLNSIVKPPTHIHAGATQNMKFSKELFTNHRENVTALLSTYWKNGGAQAMFNILGKGELEDAIKYPDNYQNLIVRVGGYSAKFVELEKDIQQEILARTLY